MGHTSNTTTCVSSGFSDFTIEYMRSSRPLSGNLICMGFTRSIGCVSCTHHARLGRNDRVISISYLRCLSISVSFVLVCVYAQFACIHGSPQ